jgi:hypothetical protein
VIQPTGVALGVPCADFWYLEDGKVEEFNCLRRRGVDRRSELTNSAQS